MKNNDESWTDLVPAVVKPAVYAYKYRKVIQEYWKKAQVKVGLGKPSIIITGRAAVGKTVLASHYHGEANSLDWKEPGTSTDVEIKPITVGDWTQIVAVIPGQNTLERAKALDSALNKSTDLDGVIHVVDWGYTPIRDSAIKQNMIDSKKIDSIEKIRTHNLDLELKDFESMLEKLTMSISSGRGPKWLVIAVNKIDLFTDELSNAKQYYHSQCESKFSSIIKSFYSTIGKNNINIITLPICSMPEPFEWNKVIITPQIDSITKQRNYFRTFIEQIAILQNRNS